MIVFPTEQSLTSSVQRTFRKFSGTRNRYYVGTTAFTSSLIAYNSGNALTTAVYFPVVMRATATISISDASGTAGKISTVASAGARLDGVTPPSSLYVSDRLWQYTAGGISSGTPGMIWGSYTASAEL